MTDSLSPAVSHAAATTPAEAEAINSAGLTHRQVLWCFTGLLTGMFLGSLDATIVNTALPTIVGDLGGLSKISWVSSGYLLTSTAATPLFGKLGDLYGRKRLFLLSVMVFVIGSLLSGIAQTMTQLIGARAVQGLGGGGIFALSMAIIAEIVSPRERGRYQGYIVASFALSSVAGPAVGGLFTDHLSWRWAFLCNVPLGIGATVLIAVVLKLPVHTSEAKVDYLGAMLVVGAVSLIVLTGLWGGREHAWGSPTILAMAAGGIGLSVLFVLQERRAPDPMLPLRIFRNDIVTVTSIVLVLLGIVMFAAFLYLPLFFQVVEGASATRSGFLMVPLAVGVMIGSFVAGRLLSRLGRYRIFPIIGTLFVLAGMGILATLDRDTSHALVFAAMILIGTGIGLAFSIVVIASQNACDYKDLGVVTASGNFFRSLGGVLGLAAFGALLNNRLAHHFLRLVPGAAGLEPDDLFTSPERIRNLEPAVREGAIETMARSIHIVFLAALPIALIAFFVTLKLREIPLRTSVHDTDSRDVSLAEPLI
jgi:EmrB/QacA subfamily drug resistance transporter